MCFNGGIFSSIMAHIGTSGSNHMRYDRVDVVQDKERFFPNNTDRTKKEISEYVHPSNSKFSDKFTSEMLEHRNKLLDILLQKVKNQEKSMLSEDITVYTGISGLAMLYLKVAKEGDGYSYLKGKALKYLQIAISNRKYKTRLFSRPTFLCGLAGALTLNALAGENLDQANTESYETTARESVDMLLRILPSATSNDKDLPNELLYGRAGYLYSLLLLKKNSTNSESEKISNESIKTLALAIINNGVDYAKNTKRKVPMWWEWHGKEYIGAAHGICGILYILLAAKAYISEEIINDYIKPTLDYFASLQYPSGNFPSSISGTVPPTNDKLLHWCHGAPGAIHLLLKAHEIWPNNVDCYFTRAQHCAESIWTRGLLKKGYGLCHGVAGNTYAFVAMWKVTNDPKYLYKAALFAEWCFEYGKRNCPVPDRPLSLFEGLAGTIYLLTDLIQDPTLACFPAYCDI